MSGPVSNNQKNHVGKLQEMQSALREVSPEYREYFRSLPAEERELILNESLTTLEKGLRSAGYGVKSVLEPSNLWHGIKSLAGTIVTGTATGCAIGGGYGLTLGLFGAPETAGLSLPLLGTAGCLVGGTTGLAVGTIGELYLALFSKADEAGEALVHSILSKNLEGKIATHKAVKNITEFGTAIAVVEGVTRVASRGFSKARGSATDVTIKNHGTGESSGPNPPGDFSPNPNRPTNQKGPWKSSTVEVTSPNSVRVTLTTKVPKESPVGVHSGVQAKSLQGSAHTHEMQPGATIFPPFRRSILPKSLATPTKVGASPIPYMGTPNLDFALPGYLLSPYLYPEDDPRRRMALEKWLALPTINTTEGSGSITSPGTITNSGGQSKEGGASIPQDSSSTSAKKDKRQTKKNNSRKSATDKSPPPQERSIRESYDDFVNEIRNGSWDNLENHLPKDMVLKDLCLRTYLSGNPKALAMLIVTGKLEVLWEKCGKPRDSFDVFVSTLTPGPNLSLDNASSERESKLGAKLSSEARLMAVYSWALGRAIEEQGNHTRTSGRNQSAHLARVGTLAIQSDATPVVALAAFFHDILEIDPARQDDMQRKLSEYVAELGDGILNLREGPPYNHVQLLEDKQKEVVDGVLHLIKLASETRGRGISWKERKSEIENRLSNETDEFAELLLILKTEGLMEAVGVLNKNLPLSQWSKGTEEENLDHYRRLQTLFKKRSLNPSIQDLYDHYLSRFEELLKKPRTH